MTFNRRNDMLKDGRDSSGIYWRARELPLLSQPIYTAFMAPGCRRTVFHVKRFPNGSVVGLVLWEFNTVKVQSKTPDDPASWEVVVIEREGQGARGFAEPCPPSFKRRAV